MVEAGKEALKENPAWQPCLLQSALLNLDSGSWGVVGLAQPREQIVGFRIRANSVTAIMACPEEGRPALPCQFGVMVMSSQSCLAIWAQLSQKAMKARPLATHKVLSPI